MELVKLAICLLALAIQYTYARETTADALRNCDIYGQTKNANAINDCMTKILNGMMQEAMDGKSTIGLPQLDPMNLANFTFVQGEGPVQITSTFRDFIVRGLKDYKLTKVEVTPEDTRITFGINIPILYIEGQYKMDGNALLLRVHGDGDMYSEVRNLDGTVTSRIVIKEKNGKKILGVTDTVVDFTLGGATTNLSNLFDGDPILDETIHHFINNNNFLILEGLQPVINAEIGNFLERILEPVFDSIPVNALFPNESP